MQSKEFLLLPDMENEVAGTGMKRQIMGYNDDIMMVRVLFEKGAVGTEHTHPHIQTSCVVRGKFEVTINGNKQILQTGEGFFVPSNLPHSAVCLEEGELIDVFTPVRKDFLHLNSEK